MIPIVHKTFNKFDNSILDTDEWMAQRFYYGERYIGTVHPEHGSLRFKSPSGMTARKHTSFKHKITVDVLKVKKTFYLLDVLMFRDIDMTQYPLSIRLDCPFPKELSELPRFYNVSDIRKNRDMVLVRRSNRDADYWVTYFRYPQALGFIRTITKDKIMLAILKNGGIVHDIGGIKSVHGVTAERMAMYPKDYVGRVVETTTVDKNIIATRFRDDLTYESCIFDPKKEYDD